jgi:hypothetical protein
VIADPLDSDTEIVRLGALGSLDDLAEAADHKDYDLTPVVSSLFRVFAREGRDCEKTRLAAARVLNWLILRRSKARCPRPPSCRMASTSWGLPKCAELRAIKRFAAKHGEG